MSLSATTVLRAERLSLAGAKSRRVMRKPIKPITTFDRNFRKAVKKAFDRASGNAIPASTLKTYMETLSYYHLQPESKFLNGDYFDQGTTTRRHVRMISCEYIGKESNNWERQAILGFDPDTAPDYGLSSAELASVPRRLDLLIKAFGAEYVARLLRISPAKLATMRSPHTASVKNLAKVAPAQLVHMEDEARAIAYKRRKQRDELRQAVKVDGLRATARRLGTDPSNLRRKLL